MRSANIYFFGGLECVGHSFAYVANFGIFERCLDSNQRAAIASWRATNLATHLPGVRQIAAQKLQYVLTSRF